MGIRQFKPITKGTRFRSVSDFAEITRSTPEKSLVEPLRKSGGRDNHGHIAVRRRGEWLRVKDRGHVDEDGYVFHAGRSDDVIISAGWTMSALEIEQALLAHPDVREAAVIGVADALRGQIPKACVVAPGKGAGFVRELQEFVKDRLSKHEYPRAIELVEELPKTPAGKVDRKTLRDRAT